MLKKGMYIDEKWKVLVFFQVAADRLWSPLVWVESLGSAIGGSGGQVNSNCAVGSTMANWYDCTTGINGVRKGIGF